MGVSGSAGDVSPHIRVCSASSARGDEPRFLIVAWMGLRYSIFANFSAGWKCEPGEISECDGWEGKWLAATRSGARESPRAPLRVAANRVKARLVAKLWAPRSELGLQTGDDARMHLADARLTQV